ncbi:MAG: ABC transporter permease [Verrucomicrobiota bacterium]|jgi:putative ABC transport system permease protein
MRALQELLENIRLALSAIRAHPLRSVLTVLGILVGVFSIVLVMTAIRVLQANLETQMSQLGTHTFQVQRFPAIQVEGGPEAWQRYARRRKFRMADARRLIERASLASAVSVVAMADTAEASSEFARTNPNIPLNGVSPSAFITRNWIVAEGRALGEPDAGRNVCVLGAGLAKKLFPRGSAIGQPIKYRGVNYAVVGVLEEKGAVFGQSQDNFMAVPIETVMDRYGRELSFAIQVQAHDAASYNATVEQARGILRALRKVAPGAEDDFEIISNDSVVTQFRGITSNLRTGSAVISSIALVAAGVGIMNIMLVSVTERTKEIGIRRAIGAKKRSIMAQFLCEAVVLSEIGGIAGVGLGIVSGNLLSLLLGVPPVLPWDWAIIGLLVCSFVGIAFGTYPAWKAAQLDPIESLRYE